MEFAVPNIYLIKNTLIVLQSSLFQLFHIHWQKKSVQNPQNEKENINDNKKKPKKKTGNLYLPTNTMTNEINLINLIKWSQALLKPFKI